MKLILDRSWLDSQYISKMTFQENYNKTGWFKNKNLAYCFFTIPGTPISAYLSEKKNKMDLKSQDLYTFLTSMVNLFSCNF